MAETAGGTWAAVTLALGVLAALLGVAVLVTSRRWPASSRRYSAVQFDEAGQSAAAGQAGFTRQPGAAGQPDDAPARGRDASVSDWDTLSDGRDPTGSDR